MTDREDLIEKHLIWINGKGIIDEAIACECADISIKFAKEQCSKQLILNGVSCSSRKIILQLLNNSLKYGTKLLVNCDDEDEQQQIDIWRSNQEIIKAIQEIENYI